MKRDMELIWRILEHIEDDLTPTAAPRTVTHQHRLSSVSVIMESS